MLYVRMYVRVVNELLHDGPGDSYPILKDTGNIYQTMTTESVKTTSI